ncbi:MAG: NlpC/P60 family protein [Bacteroidota bacterium]
MPTFRSTFIALGALVLLAGCGTGSAVRGPSPATEQAQRLPPTNEIDTERRLLAAAEDWLGTPYRFGGTTRSGVDCSALVRAVYAGAFGLGLTRSTRTQVREGREVARSDLRTGDLVFFRTGPNRRHVGIYLDGDRLLHASSSQDRVLVDDFTKRHFQRTYWTARRFLDVGTGIPAAPPVAVQSSPETPPGPSGPMRSGW